MRAVALLQLDPAIPPARPRAAATALVETTGAERDLATFWFAVAALLWDREGRPLVDNLPF